MGIESKESNDTPPKKSNLDGPQQDFSKVREAVNDIKALELISELEDNEYRNQYTADSKREIEALINSVMKGKGNNDNIFAEIKATMEYLGRDPKEFIDFLKDISQEETKKENQNSQRITENIQVITETKTGIETTTQQDRRENIKNLASSLSILLPANGKPYEKLLHKFLQVNPQNPGPEFDALLAQLNDKDTLFALSFDLKSTAPQAYEIFKSSAIRLQPSLRAKFEAQEPKLRLALRNAVSNNATIKDGKVSYTSKDGYTTTTNLDGTERTFGRSDSSFKLNTALASDELIQAQADKLENELHAQLKPITAKLESLDTIRKHLETASPQETNLADIKEDIKASFPELYAELELDSVNSLVELKNAIDKYTTELTNKKDKIINKAEDYLNILSEKLQTELEAKQKTQKKILNILHGAGIDFAREGFLDIVVDYVNQNMEYVGTKTKIDLDNGSLGFDTKNGNNEHLSNIVIEKFLDLINRGVFFNTGYSFGWLNGNVVMYSSEENAKAKIPEKNIDIAILVKKALGNNPAGKFIQNLKESISKFGKIGSKKKSKNEENSESGENNNNSEQK